MASSSSSSSYGSFPQETNAQYFELGQSRTSTLSLFIDRRLIQEIPAEESRTHLVARRLLQVISVIAGYGGRIPFIELNLELAGSNKAYAGVLTYGTCASFGSFTSYILLEVVDSQMRPLTEEEHILTESRVTPLLKKVSFAASVVLGCVIQIPIAFIAYSYNPPSTFNPDGIVMPLITFSVDSWMTIYSAYMGMETLMNRQSLTDYEKQLSQVREKMHSLIEDNRKLLALVGEETRTDFLASYEAIRNVTEPSERVIEFYELFTRRISDQTFEISKPAKYAENTVRAYGYVSSLCDLITLSYLAWLGTDELTKNSIPADVIITALYAGASLYLNLTAIPETAVTLYNLFKSLTFCEYQPTLSDRLTPKLSFCLKSLSLVTAALSYASSIDISKDYYGFNEGAEIFMEIMLTSANTFLVSMAMLSITEQILELKVEKLGSEEEKALMKIHKKMERFASVLKSSPLIEVARFMRVLPQDAVDQLIANTEVTLENLEEYLSSQAASSSSFELAPLL